MVLEYYGIKKNAKELGELSGCTEEGVGAQGLILAAKMLGLQG